MASASPSMNEDCVKYMLFPKLPSDESSVVITKALETIVDDFTAKLSPFLSQYLWQKEPFRLRINEQQYDGTPPRLWGSTCFGDNIEDEWFIVFLLLELTKEDPNLVVKIEDNDGEFLLIEAAAFIPKWLNPETSENRVFLYQGSVHIIPVAQNPAQITTLPSGIPSLTDAVSTVRQYSSVTRASQNVQKSIFQRIMEYPSKIQELQHRSHCYVPASVANILKHEPTLLSSAINAFYYRDVADMKACRAMKYFPPETRVMTDVRFTRCLYAQLIQQKFEPDKRTGWNMPPPNNPCFKSHDLGMKLACGFEILAGGVKNSPDYAVQDDFKDDIRWKYFVQALKAKNYFRGELENSRLYRELLAQAKNFYCQTVKSSQDNNNNPGIRVLHLLGNAVFTFEELKAAEKYLQPPDDDSWLVLTPDDLDTILEERAGIRRTENAFTKNNEKSQEKNSLATEVVGNLSSFIHHTSDLEGAEFPKYNSKTKKQKVNFDPDAFSDAVHTILDFPEPVSDDDSSSSMSGYSDEDGDDIILNNDKDCEQEKNASGKTSELMDDLKLYMDEMDKELSKTNVGLSFERLPASKPETTEPDAKEEAKIPKDSEEPLEIDEEFDDDFQPVDVDLTALKNILESYSSQQGLPGPASNILSSMGVHLPPNADSI